ncbi:MAG: hypothetical protein ABIN01_22205 [Ferruginibacter sp.]
MKKQSTNLLAQISKLQLENLTAIVKETLATSITQPDTKRFTAAELWDIQRRGKTRIQRRFSF